MESNNCINCNASVPEGAAFCPNCGATRNVQQQATNQYQPKKKINRGLMSSGNSSPFENIFDMIFSKTAIIIGITIGILLAWIAFVIIIFASGSYKTAVLLASIGFADISLLLIGGGLWNNKIDKFVRFGMVLIGVWAFVQTMSILSPSITGLLGSSLSTIFG